MQKKVSNPKRDRLNELGVKWCAAKLSARERENLKNEIFELILELFGKKYVKHTQVCFLDGIADFIEEDWERFDAAQGTLYNYSWKHLHDHAVDIYREEARKNGRNVSLDAPAYADGEADTPPLLETVAWAEDEYPELASEQTTKLLSLVVRFPERLRGRANNPEKLNYYRMFFTDGVSHALRNGALDADKAPWEREVLDAIKTEFLDYFKSRPCRTAHEIRDCPLKAWGAMVPGRPMTKEPEQPLPNDVYKTYLNEQEGKALKSESTITNQRTAFQAFMREIAADYLN